MRVVLVDDEFYALEVLKIKLQELENIELVGTFEDSKKFLSEVDQIRPDLVLLDIEMPKMNGFEVLKKLQELQRRPKVIFVTAYSHYRDRIAASDAIGYIVKPVTREQLIASIGKAEEIIQRNTRP